MKTERDSADGHRVRGAILNAGHERDAGIARDHRNLGRVAGPAPGTAATAETPSALSFTCRSIADKIPLVLPRVFSEMSTTPRDVLIEIVARHGEPLLASLLRIEGLFKDYSGKFRREIFVLVSCL